MLCDDTLRCVFMTLPLQTLQYVKRVNRQFRRCARNVICSEEWVGMTGHHVHHYSYQEDEYEESDHHPFNFYALQSAITTHWTTCRLPVQVEHRNKRDNTHGISILHDIEIRYTDKELGGDPIHEEARIWIKSLVWEIPGKGVYLSVDEARPELGLQFTREDEVDFRFLSLLKPCISVGGRTYEFEPLKERHHDFCSLYHCCLVSPPVVVRHDGRAAMQVYTSLCPDSPSQ